MKKRMPILAALLVWGLTVRLQAELRPAILFASPQGAGYGNVDLDYLKELHEHGFEVDYTDTLGELNWVWIGTATRMFPCMPIGPIGRTSWRDTPWLRDRRPEIYSSR